MVGLPSDCNDQLLLLLLEDSSAVEESQVTADNSYEREVVFLVQSVHESHFVWQGRYSTQCPVLHYFA